MSEHRSPADVESEQRAALRAAIQAGIDDVEAGRYEDVENVDVWVERISETVTTRSVA